MASNPSTPYNRVTEITPVMHDTELTSDSYLQRYFSHAEGFVPNKFHVGFSGEYVEKALTIMQVNCAGDKYTNAPKLFNGSPYLMKKFSNFIADHWDNEKRILNMLWNCKSVTLPKPTLEMTDIDSLDSMKGLSFQLPKKIQGSSRLRLTVVDNQYLMWFNFFNAIFNSQISPLVLRTKSGFHKIDITVELLNGATANDWAVDMNKAALAASAPWLSYSPGTRTNLDVIQMSEYNSAVLVSAPTIDPNNSNMDLATFDVEFSIPNPLNGTFKRSDRGLHDNTSVTQATVGSSETTLDYNLRFWERTKTNMTATRNNYEALNSQDEVDFNKRFKQRRGFVPTPQNEKK
jgi:hypothetical protein